MPLKLKKLNLKDEKIFNGFLNLSNHELSVFAFENIYIWKCFYDISWAIINDSLCVFFRDKIGCFLYLPLLCIRPQKQALQKAFEIMDSMNSNKDVSRIENIEEQEIESYSDLGYECRYKSTDYICSRRDLADLRGNKFKSKRSSFNYFIKNYAGFKYLPFSLKDKSDCLKLFDIWAAQRQTNPQDKVYLGMIDDSMSCLNFLFDNYRRLQITGRVVKINRELKAFSFGYKLNKDCFCILFEITDLTIKGLAQFIFHEFAAELKDFRYINIMDDSGLENLKKVKLSYHPVKLIPAYIATRGNLPKPQ